MQQLTQILDILQNRVFFTAAAAWLIAEAIKVCLRFFLSGDRGMKKLWGSGDMPSAHSATVTALAGAIGFTYGFESYPFALGAVLALVVMYDARGVRRAVGRHAGIINSLQKTEEKTEEKALDESVGHTTLQVFCGAVLGVVISFVAAFI